MNDIIVVVPRGTRVRYIESDLPDGRFYTIDATKLAAEVLGTFGPLPVHNAERHDPDGA